MAVVVGTAVAYLTLDTTGYREAVAAAGETMRQFAQSAEATGESFVSMGAGARSAAAEVKAQIAGMSGDYQRFGDLLRTGQAADSAFFRAELAARHAAAGESLEAIKKLYDRNAEDFQAAEALKTMNQAAELKRQEREVRLSADANVATLKEFVPQWYSVGQEYGNMLLAGIQGTRDRIVAYLTDISNAVNTAAAGGYDFDIRAYAAGTDNARKGLAVVGEEGPEIVDFSGGEAVLSYRQSLGFLNEAMAAMSEAAEGVAATDGYYGGGSAAAWGSEAAGKGFDYKRLAEEIAGAVRPSLTYSPTYNSPAEMSVAEMRRIDRVSAERMGFGY